MLLQSINEYHPISLILLVKYTFFKLLQYAKVQGWMVVTFLGMFISVKLVQFWNAEAPIMDILRGKDIFLVFHRA